MVKLDVLSVDRGIAMKYRITVVDNTGKFLDTAFEIILTRFDDETVEDINSKGLDIINVEIINVEKIEA